VTFTIHATVQGLTNAVTDGYKRGWMNANMQSSLIGTLNTVSKNNAKTKLSQFINTIKSSLGTSITTAYGNTLINWAQDLSARS